MHAISACMNPESQNNSTGNSSSENAFLFSGLTVGRLAALIVVLLFALFPGVILCTHSFFFRDYGLFTYPVAYFEHESFWRGEVPLWNPWNNCGVPFFAQWNTSACYPPSLIFMLLPLPQSLNYFLLAHLVLAGAGMFLLARRWTENNLAAAVAGIAFALNGLMLNSLIWTSNLAALSWEPLVILTVEQAWQTNGRKKIILAASAGAMQMLSGAPEIILFTWTVLAAIWISQIAQKKISFAPSFHALVMVSLLVAALSAIQLLPFLDLLKYSDRSIGTEGADAFPMPIWGWANLLVPFFHCFKDVFGSWLQPRQAWTSSYYVGIGTMALAFVAVSRLRKPVVIILAASAFWGLLLALGNDGFIYAWLKHLLPWINFARYPIKFVSMPVFAIPLLAAYGVKTLQPAAGKIPKQSERTLLVVVILLFFTMIGLLAAERLLGPDFPWRDVWNDGVLRIVFLAALAIAIFIFNRATQVRLRSLLGIALLATVIFDLMTAGLNQNPVVVAKAFGPLEFNMTAKPQFGESRAMLGPRVSTALFFASTTNPVYYLVGVRGALFENGNIPEHIPKVDGFFSLHLKNQQRIHDLLYGEHLGENLTNTAPAPLLDFLGIAQISDTNIFAWQERKSFLPLVTAGQKPIFADEAETFKKLATDEFAPRHEVFLPLAARDEIVATNETSATVRPQEFAAERLRFSVAAAAPAMVVIAQSYYHDWHAYVDGRPAHLWQANGAFQALEVPAGNHEVILRYEDWAFRLGAIISAITLAGCLIGLFLWRKISAN